MMETQSPGIGVHSWKLRTAWELLKTQNSYHMRRRSNEIIIVISIGLFGFALTQKCYCTTASCADSIAVLLSGTIGFLLGGAALTWLANPLLIISWLTFRTRPKLSFIFGILAFIIALSFLLFKRIVSDEAGNYKDIIGYRLGYWFWLGSMAIMFIASLIKCIYILRIGTYNDIISAGAYVPRVP